MTRRKRSLRSQAKRAPGVGTAPQTARWPDGQGSAAQGVASAVQQAWQVVRTEPLATPLAVFAGSRLALFALVLLFVGLFPVAPERKPGFLQAFSVWDGGWYTSIATSGYSWKGPDTQSNVAFFPLYPLLGKVAGLLLGGPQVGLFVVANVSFAVYLVYLYKLVSLDLDRESAYRSILYVAVFPLAFVYSSLYTESTMLALATAAFYYARRGQWRAAIPLATLTTLTRLAGVVILLPLAWEFYRQKGLKWQGLSLATIPAGTASYALYLWRVTGDPLAFLTINVTAWSRSFTFPWDTLRIGFDVVTRNPLSAYVTGVALVDVGTAVLFLALSVLAVKWLPAAYWLYALPATLFAISNTMKPDLGLPTAALGRYLLAIFPAFVVLGLAGRNRLVHHVVTFTFSILLGVLSIYFFSRIWVC